MHKPTNINLHLKQVSEQFQNLMHVHACFSHRFSHQEATAEATNAAKGRDVNEGTRRYKYQAVSF